MVLRTTGIVVISALLAVSFSASAIDYTYNVIWEQPDADKEDLVNRGTYWRYRQCLTGVSGSCKFINFDKITPNGQPDGPFSVTIQGEVGQKFTGQVRVCVEKPEPECSGWSGTVSSTIQLEKSPPLKKPTIPVITFNF